jgi:hypothetical protein
MRGFDLNLAQALRPWRVMSVVFAAVILCSFGIQKLLSPAGNAVLMALDSKEVTVTGTVASGPRLASTGSVDTLYVVGDTNVLYRLSNPAVAAEFAGQRVRIQGVLHENSGLLEVKTISVFSGISCSALDRLQRAS